MLMRSNHVVPAGELRKQMVQGGSVLWHDLIQFLFQGQKEAFNSVLPRFARLDEGMPNAQGSQSFTKHDAMKHRGIVGTNRIGLAELCLYLSPPENELVLCVDEKSQCQALERTQPMLPMGFGYVEGVTHDYKRHGTTTLFAALNVLNGTVLASCKPRHRHQEFLAFLREIDKAVPTELDIHCIVDNYATHSHPTIKAWLASRPRWHLHFIPTYSSWLNQVERFFSLITDKAIRRGSFTSVKQLVQRIDHFVAHYNTNCQPFRWSATADSILEKLQRLCSRISGTGH